MSDASDIDARLRMLNDELQRRKREADELKREERRSKRQEEVSLKKQIKVSQRDVSSSLGRTRRAATTDSLWVHVFLCVCALACMCGQPHHPVPT